MRIRRVAAVAAISFFIGMSSAFAGTPSLEFATSWGGPVNAVQVVGDVVFVGSGRRLVALESANLAHELGSIDLLSTVEDFVIRDGVAFVSTGLESAEHLGFCTVAIANPARMVLLDSHTVAGFFPGEIHLYGDLAYIEEHFGASEINLYDVVDPENLTHLGKAPLAAADEFELVGDYLFEADSATGGSGANFAVYDLAAAPLSPPLLAQILIPYCDGSSGDTASLFIEGPYAYLLADTDSCTGHDTLYVIDVSVPARPAVVGSYADLPVVSNDVYINAGHAFVTSTPGPNNLEGWHLFSGTRVLDVSEPRAPTLAGVFQTHGEVRAVRSSEGHGYLLDDGEGLIEVDLADPTNPVRLGNYHSPAMLRHMDKSGNLLYVVDAWNGFTILDVSNPDTTPQVVGVFQTPVQPSDEQPGINNWTVEVQSNKAYLSAGFGGVQIISVSDPAKPLLLSEFLPPVDDCYRKAVALDVAGTVLRVGFRDSCSCAPCNWMLRTYDLSKGAVLSSPLIPGGWEPLEFAYTPGTMFVGRNGPLQVLTVPSSLTPPSLMLESQPPKYARSIDLAGDLLLVAGDGVSTTDSAGCYVRDVSDPSNPVTLSYVPHSESSAIASSGPRAYCVANYNPPGPVPTMTHLLMYDVQSPTVPVLADFAVSGIVGNSGHSSDVALLVDEPHVYVASGRSESSNLNLGLEVFRVMGLPNPADLNGDGVVNGFDLAMLLAAWGPCPRGACAADLNGSGSVTGVDLAMLLGSWS